MVKPTKIQESIERLMNSRFETYGVDCPNCGTPLLRPKTIDPVTGKKLAGACPGMITYTENGQLRRKKCGYTEPIAQRTIPTATELTTVAHRNDALGYLRTYSVTSSSDVMRHRFKNYMAADEPERRVLVRCQQIAKQIADGKTVHSLLIGKTGRGKTHLAMGMLYAVLAQTGYKTTKQVTQNGETKTVYVSWKVLFVDWHELIELQKQAFKDDTLKRQVNKILFEIKQADVVVLDDFGSERDTEYSQDLVDRFWRDRENKTVIVTTNLDGKGLENRYGARTLSRMKNYGVGNGVAFSAIKDYRGEV
ncbi:ATP-binding protein [Lactiplantibacillus plantarum]|uniref:ATP-binding protein n=1 Tax=Lactiplantibacillus plantarum TaxID=1590 RepID=UPI00264F62A6|nr:ATP-binding protein [Lactiplantibacillus plantarum]MDN7062844.1 ATP-binding protein [Lactiplantibacillus plantarum]